MRLRTRGERVVVFWKITFFLLKNMENGFAATAGCILHTRCASRQKNVEHCSRFIVLQARISKSGRKGIKPIFLLMFSSCLCGNNGVFDRVSRKKMILPIGNYPFACALLPRTTPVQSTPVSGSCESERRHCRSFSEDAQRRSLRCCW